MEKERLIPISLIIVLIIIGVIIFFHNSSNNNKISTLKINYNNEEKEFTNLKVDQVIKIQDTTFYIVGIDKNFIVLNTDDAKDIKVEINESTKYCFYENDCVEFNIE